MHEIDLEQLYLIINQAAPYLKGINTSHVLNTTTDFLIIWRIALDLQKITDNHDINTIQTTNYKKIMMDFFIYTARLFELQAKYTSIPLSEIGSLCQITRNTIIHTYELELKKENDNFYIADINYLKRRDKQDKISKLLWNQIEKLDIFKIIELIYNSQDMKKIKGIVSTFKPAPL